MDDQSFLDALSQQAVRHLRQITTPEQHEVKCYIRLYEHARQPLRKQLHDTIAAHITALAKTSPDDWHGYVATPLTFVESPSSPFAGLFDQQLLLDNAHFLRQQLVGGNHWEPTWAWGQFDDAWAQAKKEWSGKLTVENLALLRAFNIPLTS